MDGAPEFKRCTKCGVEKPLDEFSITKRDGILHQCKTCMREYYRNRYQQRPDVRERMSEYYKRPDVRERYKERYKIPEVKSKIRVRQKEYTHQPEFKQRRKERQQLPDVKAQLQRWRREYRNRSDVKCREWNRRHQPSVQEQERVWAQEYRKLPEVKERLREYYKSPPVRFARINSEHKRRIYKKHACLATDEPITPAQWTAILKHQKNTCPDCGGRFTKTNPPTMDHIVPLSVAPLHSSDNIRAVCARCNSRKRDRVVPEYIQTWLYIKEGSSIPPPQNL